jgi:hypothetical protein
MRENAMYAVDPVAMHALAELFIALAVLIGSVWPNGVFK